MSDSKNREDFWKNINPGYYKTNTNNGLEQREFLAKILKTSGTSSVLELGCNSGGNLLHINKLSPDIKIVGLDICEEAIKYGKEVEKNPAEFIIGSLYDLKQFDDDSFDVVFTRGVLMHINHDSIRDVLKNMTRIAKYHTINIERHGENKIMSYGADKTPHAFSHNFKKAYKSFEIEANIKSMYGLTNRMPKGGAEHFIWTNLKGKNLL